MNTSFCTYCGTEVSDADLFCPSCGKAIVGRGANEQTVAANPEYRDKVAQSKLNLISALLIIYCIPAILFGAYMFIGGATITDMIWADEAMKKIFIDAGLNYNDILNTMELSGIVMALSGIFVLISFIMTFWRISWKVAIATCLIGTLLSSVMIVGLIAGLIVTYMIYKNKMYYKDGISV